MLLLIKDLGEGSHTAGVKIQLEYDLLSGQFLHVEAGPENGEFMNISDYIMKIVEFNYMILFVNIFTNKILTGGFL
ncbi:hypothetical protein BrL25_04000 [Brevibacillus laterosporus DSM 25]|nr:hypothetical protein BrL25_04000 [Brevibacillus laterosporus DSM 25]